MRGGMTVEKSGYKLNASSFFGGVIWMIWTGHTDILVLPGVLTSLAYHLFSLRFELVFFHVKHPRLGSLPLLLRYASTPTWLFSSTARRKGEGYSASLGRLFANPQLG